MTDIGPDEKEKRCKALFGALLSLKSEDECHRFLTDLCTPGELDDLAGRWLVARRLEEEDISYRDLAAETGISVTTVGRVARFLRQEPHKGYRLVLDRLFRK